MDKLNKLITVDNTISEHTPIICDGRVIGCTIGENKRGLPVKCVLFSHSLTLDEMISDNNVRWVTALGVGTSNESDLNDVSDPNDVK